MIKVNRIKKNHCRLQRPASIINQLITHFSTLSRESTYSFSPMLFLPSSKKLIKKKKSVQSELLPNVVKSARVAKYILIKHL